MGSIPPDDGNCISGVLVRNVTFYSPMKAVYVKPNPAKPDSGATGEISNVTYEDMLVNEPVWWPLWFGTQQQHQPGYNGTGCSFLYLLDNTTCPTDPQVTVANITLRRILVLNGNSPGIILGNASNPLRGLVFEDVVHVNSTGFPVGPNYLCTAATGVARGATAPVPDCFVDETDAAVAVRKALHKN